MRRYFKSVIGGSRASNAIASHFSVESISAYLVKRVTHMLSAPTGIFATHIREEATEIAAELMTLFSCNDWFAPDEQFQPEQQFDPNETRGVNRDDVATSVAACFVARYRDKYWRGPPPETYGVQDIRKHEEIVVLGAFENHSADEVPSDHFQSDAPGVRQARIIYHPPSVAVCWEDRFLGSSNHVSFEEPNVGSRESVAKDMKFAVQLNTEAAESSTKATSGLQ